MLKIGDKMPGTLCEEMLAAADPSLVPGLSRFFKTGPGQYGEGDKFLGIKVPTTRAIVRRCWRTADFDELERCITSEYHEVRLAALLALVEIFRHCHSERSEESIHPWEPLQAGDTVIHKSLGPGEVMAFDDKYLIVKFSDRESKFLYPSAFEKGYLELVK